jgi:biotin transport system substrate-specific component
MTKTDSDITGQAAGAKSGTKPGRKRWNATDLGLIAVFAALVAGSALIAAIPVGGLGVPITLQTLAVMLTGLALGPGRAFAAVGLYTLLGLAGLPIFSGGRSGLGILAGPDGGLADHHRAPPDLEVPGAVPFCRGHGHQHCAGPRPGRAGHDG